VATALGLWLVLVLGAAFFGNRPDPALSALFVAAAATCVWLFLDLSLRSEASLWDRDDPEPVRPPGEDQRHAMLTRVVGGHLDARAVGDALHRHLLDLVDERLVAAHGVASRADPERAAALMGPDLAALAAQRPPYPRLTVRQIDALLTRIEAL